MLYDPLDDRVLVSVDASTPRPIASTTKVMTTLLALERADPTDVVVVSAAAAAQGRVPGAATLSLRQGQQAALSSLLAGLMLRSGNDAALAVAEHVAGTEAAFVAMMNERAAELGMDATRFFDASGLSGEPANVASPVDLARLAVVALREPLLAEWAGAAVLDVPGLGTLANRNELLSVPGVTGLKTGFTSLAGLCLVATAERDGRPFVAVVLGSEASFADAAALLEHAYADYRRVAPVTAAPVVPFRWADVGVDLVADTPLGRTLPATAAASWSVELVPAADRPVDAGTELGRAVLRVGDDVVASTPLRAAEDVAAAEGPPGGVGGAVADALRAFARGEPPRRPLS